VPEGTRSPFPLRCCALGTSCLMRRVGSEQEVLQLLLGLRTLDRPEQAEVPALTMDGELARRKVTFLPPPSRRAQTAKLSHGEPTFFVHKRVFAGLSNNHHGDGHVAVVLPAAPGLQEALVEEASHAYYRPPYVGAAGWIGVELDQVSDEALESHIRQAWQLIVNKAGRR
jgi:hypothetical protein